MYGKNSLYRNQIQIILISNSLHNKYCRQIINQSRGPIWGKSFILFWFFNHFLFNILFLISLFSLNTLACSYVLDFLPLFYTDCIHMYHIFHFNTFGFRYFCILNDVCLIFITFEWEVFKLSKCLKESGNLISGSIWLEPETEF